MAHELKIDFISDRDSILSRLLLHFVTYGRVESQELANKGEDGKWTVRIFIGDIPIDSEKALLELHDRYSKHVEHCVEERVNKLLEGNEVFERLNKAIEECEYKLQDLGNWLEKRNGP